MLSLSIDFSLRQSFVYDVSYEYVVSPFWSCPNQSILSDIFACTDALGLWQKHVLYLEKQAPYYVA